MQKKIIAIILSMYLLFSFGGCAVTTSGESSWEFYVGVRARQHSEKPAKVELESSVVNKIVDSLTDGEISDNEWRAFIKCLWWTAQWYFKVPSLFDLF